MTENIFIALISIASSAIGALVLLLMGIIIHELRQLRSALKECVSYEMCQMRMVGCDARLDRLETLMDGKKKRAEK